MKSSAVVAGCALIGLAGYVLLVPNETDPHRTLVVASWGGSFQEAQRRVLFEPFTAETGIEIVETTGPTLARIKAMVDAGRAEWDVALMTPADVLRLQEDEYLAEIDYSTEVMEVALRDIDERAVLKYGIGDYFSSKVMAYNTNAYSIEHHPRTWSEFWDAERFPGLRVIDAGDWSMPPIEYALMADGVDPSDLYPLDFERAYRSIEKIAPYVLKFSTSPAMPAQALVDGEAVLAAVTLGRIAQLKHRGAPVDFEWNQGLMEVNYWVIVANSEQYETAMRFIEFTTRPEVQAAMAELQPLGPSNRRAFEFLPDSRARELPTHPDNLAKQVLVDATFWAASFDSNITNAEWNAKLWQQFKLKDR